MVLQLACGGCGHRFVPDRSAFAAARLACPRCAGWSFHAELCDPDAPIPFVLAEQAAAAGEVAR